MLLKGSAVRQGKTARALNTKNDQLRFIVYDAKNNTLLTKNSGTGIEQTDDGTYTVLIPADELNPTTFPGERYRYAVRIVEGDTGQKYLLQHGPFLLKNIPF